MTRKVQPRLTGESVTFLKQPLMSLYLTGSLPLPISQTPVVYDEEAASLPQRLDAILKVYGEKEGFNAAGQEQVTPPKAPLLSFLEKNRIPISIIVPTSIVQAPFQSLWAVREFLERKTLPVNPAAQLGPLSNFSVDLPIGHDDAPITVRVLDASQAARLSLREWHGVIGIFVSLADWQYNKYPYRDLKSLSQSVRLLLAKYEDDLELPKHLQSIQLVQLRFKDRARFNDQICWRDMTTALQSKLSRPYDFSRLEMRTN